MKHTYKGKGNHSVSQLEAICEEQKEVLHQNQLMKQEMLDIIKKIHSKSLYQVDPGDHRITHLPFGMFTEVEDLIEKASKD